jgi:putative ABC transport system permease protein
MASLLQDFRIALRNLRKNPGFTAVTVLILALGIAGVTIIFSAVDGLLLSPLPYPGSDRLVQIWETDRRRDVAEGSVSPLNLEDWSDGSRRLQVMAGYGYEAPVLAGEGPAQRLRAVTVNPAFFSVFMVEPHLGRVLSSEDEGARVAVLGHGLWQDRLGGDPAIVGRSLTLDGERYTVEERHPDTNEGQGVRLVPLQEQLVGDLRSRVLILFGAVALVLLSACANVANLLLVRATARGREVSVRAALGASRRRLLQPFLAEALALAALACALGVGLAKAGLEVLLSASPVRIPGPVSIGLDVRVLTFAVAASLATALLFGLAPALQASRVAAAGALREGAPTGGRRTQRLRRLLVASEVALAVVLLAGAGLLVTSFHRLTSVDPGFRPEGVMSMKVELTSTRYAERSAQAAFAEQAVERIEALPGVRAAGVVDDLPFSGSRSSSSFEIAGREPGSDLWQSDVRAVTPEYLPAMNVPLLAGRGFSDDDSPESVPVAIVNAAFAARWFPDVNPIGQRILIGDHRERDVFGGPVWREIVGVVGDIHHDQLASRPSPELYTPFAQRPETRVSFVVRTYGEPRAIVPSVQAALAEMDPNQPIYDIRAMEERLEDSVAAPRFHAGLLSAFAATALILTVLGIYGVSSYAVRQRTREIGIRMAVGADGSDVRRLIVLRSLVDVGAGLLAGLVAAIALGRVLAGLLYGVSPHDPLIFAGVIVLLGVAGLASSWMPARRASRIDPAVALRGLAVE